MKNTTNEFLMISEGEKINGALSAGRTVTYLGQTVLFRTHLFGKDYFWCRDNDGTHYLCHVGEYGLPDFS